MADEIIEELWAAKDAIAKEAGYDIDKLVALVQTRHDQRRGDDTDPTSQAVQAGEASD